MTILDPNRPDDPTTAPEPPDPPPAPPAEFTVEARSQRQQILRRFRRDRQAMTGLIVFGVLLLGSALGPLVYPFGYGDLDLAHKSVPPGTGGHLLGTQELGRDLLAMIMRGILHSMLISLIVVVISGTIGVVVGAVAGYYGRWAGSLLMRFVDVILTLPPLVVIVVVAAAVPGARSVVGVGIILGCFGWTTLARIVRAEFLSLREREFVEAAQAMGASARRIIFRHLIPNAMGQILVFLTLTAATSVLVEAALTFLGYGLQGNDVSLGLLVSQGVSAADSRPWLFYVPGLVLMIIVMCVNAIGDGIRAAFEPGRTRIRA